MKSKFIFTLLLSVPLFSLSQYQSFPSDSATWQLLQVSVDPNGKEFGMTSVVMRGDTILDGIVYHKIYDDYSGVDPFLGGLRQDENRRVYFFPKSVEGSLIYANFPDTTQEYLVYDFSSHEIGFQTDYFNYSTVLINYDSLEVNGAYQHRYLYEAYSKDICISNGSQYWVFEGIGSEFGPFGPYCLFETSYYLVCFHHQGEAFENEFVPYGVENCALTLDEFYGSNGRLEVYPNPCTSYTNITVFSRQGGQLQIRVFNAMGKESLQTIIDNVAPYAEKNMSIDLSSLAPGFYTISAELQGEFISSSVVKLP